MRRILRPDRDGIAAWVLLLVVVVAVVAVAAFALSSFFLARAGLSTTIVVTDVNGQDHTVFSTKPTAAIVTINGITVTQIKASTSFLGSSSDYSKYTLVAGASPVTLDLNTNLITSAGSAFSVALIQVFPTLAICGGTSQVVPSSFGTQLSVGTTYDLGPTVFGTSGPVIVVSASQIISWAGQNGCVGTGAFVIGYGVQVVIQAVGQGAVPTAKYQGKYSTPVSISAGSLTISGTTTGGP